MILRQLLHLDPVVGASYLVACAGKQAALVIGPMATPDEYVHVAEAFGTPIRYVIGTHVHADHVSTGAVAGAPAAAAAAR